MGERVVPEPHRCLLAHAGHYRSALAFKVPGEWNRFKYAGVPRSLSLPSDCADGESERVQGLVGKRSLVASRWSLGRLWAESVDEGVQSACDSIAAATTLVRLLV